MGAEVGARIFKKNKKIREDCIESSRNILIRQKKHQWSTNFNIHKDSPLL